MKKDNLKTILSDLAEQAAPPEQIDLWPAVKRSIETSKPYPIPGAITMKPSNFNYTWQRRAGFILIALVVTLIVFLAAGPGSTLAQKMWQFFQITENQSFPIPTGQTFPVPETPTPAPVHILDLENVPEEETQSDSGGSQDPTCSTQASQKAYLCQIKTAETEAGFDIKEFVYDPKGTKFSQVTYDARTEQVTMEFLATSGGGFLNLRQGQKDFTAPDDPWSKVPSGSVKQVSVNGNYAEIASGTFVVYPDATEAVWEPGGQLSLVWREGNRWFVLEKMGDPYPIEWITDEAMIGLAESLVDIRPADAVPPQDPANLKTVAEAEKMAGFDVIAPTRLLKGYGFQRAVWTGSAVGLIYGPKGSNGNYMTIFMSPIPTGESSPADPCGGCPAGTVQAVQVGPWQGWYWRGIFFTAQGVEGQPTPTPVWQADARNWVLSWQTDRLQIGISYWPPENGEEINKETLVAIAESMR